MAEACPKSFMIMLQAGTLGLQIFRGSRGCRRQVGGRRCRGHGRQLVATEAEIELGAVVLHLLLLHVPSHDDAIKAGREEVVAVYAPRGRTHHT